MKSRDKLISLVTLSALLLDGCASIGQSTLNVAQPARQDQTYFFRGFKTVDTDYIGRYACADGQPLICSCTSLHARSCDCRC
jgi:hypothetical protein